MTTTLKITGMTCNHCVQSVTRALQGVAGVKTVSVTLDPGQAVVDGSADSRALIQAVEEEGYQAEVVSAQ